MKTADAANVLIVAIRIGVNVDTVFCFAMLALLIKGIKVCVVLWQLCGFIGIDRGSEGIGFCTLRVSDRGTRATPFDSLNGRYRESLVRERQGYRARVSGK